MWRVIEIGSRSPRPNRTPRTLLALYMLIANGCGGRMAQPPLDETDATPPPPRPSRVDVWKGPLPPIPTRVSPRLSPRKILQTTRLDKKTARRRIGELALAALTVIEQMALPEERAHDAADLCREIGPNARPTVVGRLARAAWKQLQQVKIDGRVLDTYGQLARCLRYAPGATRTAVLPALLARAAKHRDLSVFSFALHGARFALTQLEPAQAEPILQLTQRALPRAREYYQREHLLTGLAATGVVLPPGRAQALLRRARAGVAGATHAESRPVYFGELAQLWVEAARAHPELSERAAASILALGATDYAKAQALGRLVELPGFANAPKALDVLKTLRQAATKLPATERAWLREKLIASSARVGGAVGLLRQLVNDADPQHAVRARLAATRALATRSPKEAIVYASEALDRIDKLPTESRRNWRQAPLFRALSRIDGPTRQPLLTRMEKRSARFVDKYFTAWTLRRLMELQRAKAPTEAARLARKMMSAVAAIRPAARRVRALRSIFKVGVETGPAAAPRVIEQALRLSGRGVSAWVWARFLRPLGQRSPDERKRWLPRLLRNIVRQAPTWRPDDLPRLARQVSRLAPQVLPGAQAEALLLQVWAAVESADKRSSEVQLRQVVNALRALGRGLAALGSKHFPTLVRRMEARIPRNKAWSEHLMSYVTSLGALLPEADREQLRKRIHHWVTVGTPERAITRRGAIIAGLVASHGALDRTTLRRWLDQGSARLSYRPMVQFLIRLPVTDLKTKAAALPSLGERARMFRVLIRATVERANREPRWRRRRARRKRRRRP